jgi:hypothetical protein
VDLEPLFALDDGEGIAQGLHETSQFSLLARLHNDNGTVARSLHKQC